MQQWKHTIWRVHDSTTSLKQKRARINDVPSRKEAWQISSTRARVGQQGGGAVSAQTAMATARESL